MSKDQTQTQTPPPSDSREDVQETSEVATLEPTVQEEAVVTQVSVSTVEVSGEVTDKADDAEDAKIEDTTETEDVSDLSDTAAPPDEGEGDNDDPDLRPESQTALSLLQVEDYINQQMKDITKLRGEMKEIKSSVDDTFQNDAQYREFEDKAKEAAKNKNAYKKQMMNDPAVSELVTKLDGMKADVKDMQIALSDYLREYNRISGMSQFETADGEMLEIVNTFKLVKKKD